MGTNKHKGKARARPPKGNPTPAIEVTRITDAIATMRFTASSSDVPSPIVDTEQFRESVNKKSKQGPPLNNKEAGTRGTIVPPAVSYQILPRVISSAVPTLLATFMRVDSYCHNVAATHLYREIKVHGFCPRHLFNGLNLGDNPTAKHSPRQGGTPAAKSRLRPDGFIGPLLPSEVEEENKPTKKRMTKVELLALTEVLEVGAHVCNFQVATKAVKAFTRLRTVKLFYPHYKLPAQPRGDEQVFCLPFGTDDPVEARLIAGAQLAYDLRIGERLGADLDVDSALRFLLLTHITATTYAEEADDAAAFYWNADDDDIDLASSRMTVNGGKLVRYPCPFLWQLQPAKVVLYPLGMDPEMQTMFAELLGENLSMIFRRAKDLTLVLPPNKTRHFWFKGNKSRFMPPLPGGGKLKIILGGWSQRVSDIFGVRKPGTIRFSREEMIDFAKLVGYMPHPVEVYVLNDSWTPDPFEFPVNTIADIESFVRALKQPGVLPNNYWRPAIVTIHSKRAYVVAHVHDEVDAACAQRWKQDVESENSGHNQSMRPLDHDCVPRGTRLSEWRWDRRTFADREADRKARYAELARNPYVVGLGGGWNY